MTTLYRQTICRWCGAELEHKPNGRDKRFCSAKCRVYWRRASQRWARASVEAILAHEPEPKPDFGYPIDMARYTVHKDGTVTKQS